MSEQQSLIVKENPKDNDNEECYEEWSDESSSNSYYSDSDR